MKIFIFIVSITVCHLVNNVYGHGQHLDCDFAHKAYKYCQDYDQTKSDQYKQLDNMYGNNLRYVTNDQPEFEIWISNNASEKVRDNFDKSRLLVKSASLINAHHSNQIKGECSHLSQYGTCFEHQQICYNTTDLKCDHRNRYRTLDGSCNNLKNPFQGAQFSAYIRLKPAVYDDCSHSFRKSSDGHDLPRCRDIGNILAANCGHDNPNPYESFANIFFAFCAQLYIHDGGSRRVKQNGNQTIQCCNPNNTGALPEAVRDEACRPMMIQDNDEFYSTFHITCINYVSSETTFSNECKPGPAEQTNTVSSAFDLSVIYGYKPDQPTLRTFTRGLLKTNDKNVLIAIRNPITGLIFYTTGDPRVNQTPMLVLCHSVFLRLHNIICHKIGTSNDDESFFSSRRLNIALYHEILYHKWLPVLFGPIECQLACKSSKKNCRKYDSNIDVSISNEFSIVSRILHMRIGDKINFYASDGKLERSEWLSDMSSSRVGILDSNYTQMLGSMTRQGINLSGCFTPELRNLLFKNDRGFGVDLQCIDIQRARDHGIAPYIVYVTLCTKKRINTWADLKPYFSAHNLEVLKKIYTSPSDIDLIVGVQLERPTGPLLGVVASCIICDQFTRSKFGDRFFCQRNDGPNPFTKRQQQEIKNFTPSKFLCLVDPNIRNVPRNAFEYPSANNPMISCDSLPEFDFDLFKE